MFVIKPLSHYVMVRFVEPDEGSTIVMPDAVKAGLGIRFAEVILPHDPYVSINSGATIECPVKAGDFVMFLACVAAPLKVKHGEKEYDLIPSNAIISLVTDLKEKPKIDNIQLLS